MTRGCPRRTISSSGFRGESITCADRPGGQARVCLWRSRTRSTGRSATSVSRSPTAATSAASTACRRRSSGATTPSCRARDLLTFEEITRLARVFAGLGVEKIRITGGEPLVRRNVEHLVAMLAAIPGLDLTLTTNGAVLAQKAQALTDAGLGADHGEPRLARRRRSSAR